ncbi:MAG: hypothetical protein QUV05_08495, partial [Phycisphaerae bacterium]|nr:hypothetical protein [Phycisphaerae bacterium]
MLKPEHEKSRRGAEILIRADLAKDLSRHLAERLCEQQRAAVREGRAYPVVLSSDEPLFRLPDGLVKRFDRDLVAAGIARPAGKKGKWRVNRRDALGRSLDIHCLRTTFNSLMAAASVPLTTRRILMRHAAAGITDEHYTDRTLIDLRGALDRLPVLPLDGAAAEPATLAANGTDHAVAEEVNGGQGAIGGSVCSPVYSTPRNSGAQSA